MDAAERAELLADGWTEAEIATLDRARRRMAENGGEMTDGQRRGWLQAMEAEGG